MDDLFHHGHGIPYLTEVVIFLVSAVVIVPLCQRLKISPILGFLTAGILVGPSAFNLADDVDGVRALAELGIVFLLFTIGLELSFERLKAMRRLVFGLGASQVALSALAIGIVAWVWDNSLTASAIIGLALALSSTAMVLQLLIERGAMTRRHGRTSFAILLFQDLAVVPVLILISVISMGQNGDLATNLGWAASKAIIAIVAILVFGRFLMHRIYRIVASTKSPEAFVAMTLLMILGVAIVTEQAGLSMALGAFLVGLLLSETEYRHQIESDIAPFKGLLLGLFFISVGMSIDFGLVDRNGAWILASVLGLIGLKALLAGVLCLVFGIARDIAIRVALLLAAGGEFAFVILNAAMLAGVLPEAVGQFMIIVASLSMLITPALAILGDRIAPFITPRGAQPGPIGAAVEDLDGHVLIAGFGRVGQTVADLLARENVPYVALDLDASRIWRARRRNLPVFYGDATRPDVLMKVGAERASVVLMTLDEPKDANRTVQALKAIRGNLTIIARATDGDHARELRHLGADNVVIETLEASLQMAGTVLRNVDKTPESIGKLMEGVREEQYDGITDWRVPYIDAGFRTNAPPKDPEGNS